MSILRDQDALVVYRQELGAPVALTSVTVDRDANINFTSGETYTVDTENTGTDVNGEAAESTGTGLTLDILLVDGSITDTRIVDAGTGYKKNDVLTVVGGTGKVYAADVGFDGEVTLVYTQDAGSGYSVSKGFLNPVEAQGGTGSGLIVLPVITGGELATFTPVGTVFQPIQSDGDAVDYTVGDEIRFETAPGDVYATATVAYVNITGQSQSSGGAFRYDGEQLFDDVDERINHKFDTTPADIRVETVDFDRTDDTHKFEGDLTLQQEADPSVTSVITFQRSGAVDYVVDDYGYNFKVDSNEYDTSKTVDTQAEFNKKIYQKVQFIEDNIYFPRSENDTELNNESPRLHVDTQVKTLGTYNNVANDDYDKIPSYKDVTKVKEIADGNVIDIAELRNDLTNFETGGLIFKGNVNALNQVPLLADTSVGWFWVASEDYTDAELGDIEEGVTIAVREDGDDDKAFQYIYRTSYDGIFLALNNETDIPQVVKGTVEFDIAGAKEFSITDNGIPIFNLDASGGNFTQQIRFDARTEHISVYFHEDGNSVGSIVPDYNNHLLYYKLSNETLVGHQFYSGVKISPDSTSNTNPGILEITGKSPSDDVATAYIKLGYSNSSDSYIRYYRTNTVELETGTFQTEASLKLNAGSGDSYLSSNVDSAAADCSVSYAGLISEDSHITNKKYVDDEITAKIDETIDYIDEKADLSLGELNDVTLSNPSSGQVLTFHDDGTDQFWGTSKALTLNVADDTNTLTSDTWVRTQGNKFFIANDVANTDTFIVLSKGGTGTLIVTSEGEVTLAGNGEQNGFIATNPKHAVTKYVLDTELDSRETTIKEHVADGYVSKSGDVVKGKLYINLEQPQDSATNGFRINGRIRNSDGDVVTDILLKDYRRTASSQSPDYIAYYGEGGGSQEIINRKTMEKYVNDSVAAGSNVQVVAGTPSNIPLGKMWFDTTKNALFLKTSN